MDASQYYFPVFKGLQKPLEFMGIRGRFMIYAAAGVGMSFFGFCIGAFVFTQIVGLIVCAVMIGISYLAIFFLQKQGLYAKKKCRDIIIYHTLFK